MEKPPERVVFSCYNQDMSKENAETLKVYDQHADAYLETVERHKQSDPEKARKKRENLNEFYKNSFSTLQAGAKIFEIGSGDGEDAAFLTSLGYRVQGSDVAEDFIRATRSKNVSCKKFNLLEDEFDDIYDGALAWRIFVHFSKEDLKLALKKIYSALRPGGIFICNILNAEDHGGKEGEWVDFDNDYHMGVERYFFYHKEEETEKIFADAGFNLQYKRFEGGDSGKRWFVFVCEKPTGVNPELKKYIETEILPQYKKLSGHTGDHINQVIGRSLAIVNQMDVDRNIVYTTAAFHDLGRLVDNETHNLESGKMVRADEGLKNFFSEEAIETIAQAVEDHRASLKGDPRSIYGKIVSSADRNMSMDAMLSRSYDYARVLHPEMTDDEVIEEARFHLREKFSPDGYGAKKDFFPAKEAVELYQEIERITRDPLEYRKIVKEFNKKRGLKPTKE